MQDLELRLRSATWSPAAGIARPFVRHPQAEPSPGEVWRVSLTDRPIRLSVVIPTMDAHRNGYFAHLLSQIGRQDLTDFELIVIKGDPRQGRAINLGAALAQGPYLLILDDDTHLPDPETFRKLVATLEAHPEIGMAGGKRVVVVPDVCYHHLPPDRWGRLLKQFFRNGRQAAFVNRYYPHWVIETPAAHGAFVPQVPFWRRALRYPPCLFQALLTGQWVGLACELSYVSGFLWGWVTHARGAQAKRRRPV